MTAPARLTVTRMLKAVALCGAVLALLGLIGFGAFLVSLDHSEREPEARADAIVVLTGGSQRIGEGIELLAKGFGRRLLITGVNERTGRAEIEKFRVGHGAIVQCCVDLDYRARNTVENALETRRWVRKNGFNSLVVVTSNYHMPRTLLELEHVLPDVRKVAYPVIGPHGPWANNLGALRLFAGEYAKYVAVWARRRLGSQSSGTIRAELPGEQLADEAR